MRRLLVALLTLVGAFALVSWWALEWSGVAIVETEMADGSTRSTHVWYTEPSGEVWLEAGTPTNGWYLDVQREPALVLTIDGSPRPYEAATVAGRGAHERIRSLIREKYGSRDVWVNLFVDTSESIGVRLITPR